MYKFLCTIVFCAQLILAVCQHDSDLVLAQNGFSDYQIVIPELATDYEKKAASELQHYLFEISQAELPVVEKEQAPNHNSILVGAGHHVGLHLNPHQITIQEKNGQLIVAGGNARSALYAVYYFLEHFLGCRFYAPEVEKIPRRDSVRFEKGLNYSYEPSITTRTVHSRLFYENHEFADKRKVTYDAFPGYVPGARVHTFHRFVPEAKYFKEHPEYYALRSGRRTPTQLCLTNPEVLEIVVDTVADLLSQNPQAGVISVSQDDNQQHCQCLSCAAIDQREESPSGSLIAFVNDVAAEFPDKLISTLAYQYTRKPPKQLKPAKNVLVTLCSIECDRSAPIADNCRAFADDLIGWGKKTTNIRIWDYTTQFTNFLAPFPNLQTIQPNIQLFKSNNTAWVFEQHSRNPSELFELRSYLMAELLWNPELNVDSLMDDFLTGYYHEAGVLIRQYIDRIHLALAADPEYFLFLYGDPSQAFSSFLKPKLLAQYDLWFDQAEKAVAGKPEVLQRVELARLGVDYAILEASRKQISPAYRLISTDTNGNPVVPEKLKKRLKNFKTVCANANIEWMNEMRYSVKEYVQSYEHTLNRARQTNKALERNVSLTYPPKKYANEDPQVLTDGAFGGSSFYANWLGFEGNDMEAIIDLEQVTKIEEISCAFLQVTNHIVFLPEHVSYSVSDDGINFSVIGTLNNPRPLSRESKVNDIEFFTLSTTPTNARYIKVFAKNMGAAPIWHHGARLPSWIFADEVAVR